jgi:hypothetical protein
MTKKIDRLFENFAGERVTIVVNKDVGITIETENGSQAHNIPMNITGFLTDADDDYLYLGYEQNALHHAIRREFIVLIEIADEKDYDDEIMDAVKTPKGSRGYN